MSTTPPVDPNPPKPPPPPKSAVVLSETSTIVLNYQKFIKWLKGLISLS